MSVNVCLNVTIILSGFCWCLEGGRHEPEHNACGQRQQTGAQEGSEQISAQLSKFNADFRTRNSFLNRNLLFLQIVQKI